MRDISAAAVPLSGLLTALALVLCAAKYIAHRLPRRFGDAALLRLHKPASLVLFGGAMVHAGLAPWLAPGPSVLQLFTGFVLLAAVLGTVISHMLCAKHRTQSLRWHRICTAVLLLCLPLHWVAAQIAAQGGAR